MGPRRRLKLLSLLALLLFLIYAALRFLSSAGFVFLFPQEEPARAHTWPTTVSVDSREGYFLSDAAASKVYVRPAFAMGEDDERVFRSYLPVYESQNSLSPATLEISSLDGMGFSQEQTEFSQENSESEETVFPSDQSGVVSQNLAKMSQDLRRFSQQNQAKFPQNQEKFPQNQANFQQNQANFPSRFARYQARLSQHDTTRSAQKHGAGVVPMTSSTDSTTTKSIQSDSDRDYAISRPAGHVDRVWTPAEQDKVVRGLDQRTHDRHKEDPSLEALNHQRSQGKNWKAGSAPSDVAVPRTSGLQRSPSTDVLQTRHTSDVLHSPHAGDLLHSSQSSDALHRQQSSDVLHRSLSSDVLHRQQSSDVLHRSQNSDVLHRQQSSDVSQKIKSRAGNSRQTNLLARNGQPNSILPVPSSVTDRGQFNSLHKPVQYKEGLTHSVHHPTNPQPLPKCYLVYLCEGEEERCGGWADRQRGMLSVFLLAHVTDRVFKVDMRAPCNLTNFLHPVGQDWWTREDGEQSLWGGGGGIAVVNDMRKPVLPGILQSNRDFNAQFPHGTVYVQTTRDVAVLLARHERYRLLLPEWARHSSQAQRFRMGWPLLAAPTASITRKLANLFLPLTRSRQSGAGDTVSPNHQHSVHDAAGGKTKATGSDGGNRFSDNRLEDSSGNRLGESGGDFRRLSDVSLSAGNRQGLTGEKGNTLRDKGPTLNNPEDKRMARDGSSTLTGSKDGEGNAHTSNVLTGLGANVLTGNTCNDTHNTCNDTQSYNLVCAHLRMGRNPNMPEDTSVRNGPDAVHMAFTFLEELMQIHNSFVFIATDDQGVRMAARAQFKKQLLDHGGAIVHIDRQGKQIHACAGFETTILDQLVLSHCDVLVMSRSGFSRHAAYLRQHQQGLFLLNDGIIERYSLS